MVYIVSIQYCELLKSCPKKTVEKKVFDIYNKTNYLSVYKSAILITD